MHGVRTLSTKQALNPLWSSRQPSERTGDDSSSMPPAATLQGAGHAGQPCLPEQHHDWQSPGQGSHDAHSAAPVRAGVPLELPTWASHHEAPCSLAHVVTVALYIRQPNFCEYCTCFSELTPSLSIKKQERRSLPDCQCADSRCCINNQPHSTCKQMLEVVSVADMLFHSIKLIGDCCQSVLPDHAVQFDQRCAPQGM